MLREATRGCHAAGRLVSVGEDLMMFGLRACGVVDIP